MAQPNVLITWGSVFYTFALLLEPEPEPVRKPYVDYTEVFLDDGQVDMFAVMKELVRQKYPRAVYPEHPRALEDPRRQPGARPAARGAGRAGVAVRARG